MLLIRLLNLRLFSSAGHFRCSKVQYNIGTFNDRLGYRSPPAAVVDSVNGLRALTYFLAYFHSEAMNPLTNKSWEAMSTLIASLDSSRHLSIRCSLFHLISASCTTWNIASPDISGDQSSLSWAWLLCVLRLTTALALLHSSWQPHVLSFVSPTANCRLCIMHDIYAKTRLKWPTSCCENCPW